MMPSAVKTLSVPNVPKVSVILTGLAPTRRTAAQLTLSVVTMTECATYPPLTPLIAVLTVTMGSVSEVRTDLRLCDWTASSFLLGCADLGSGSENCPSTHPTCGSTHQCGCSESSECDKYDGECDMDAMWGTDSYIGHCYYCDGDKAQCVPGIPSTRWSEILTNSPTAGCGGLASSNNNCPAGYECDLSTHECSVSVCDDNSFCAGWDQICNTDYDNCAFCGGDCEAEDWCCPGIYFHCNTKHRTLKHLILIYRLP